MLKSKKDIVIFQINLVIPFYRLTREWSLFLEHLLQFGVIQQGGNLFVKLLDAPDLTESLFKQLTPFRHMGIPQPRMLHVIRPEESSEGVAELDPRIHRVDALTHQIVDMAGVQTPDVLGQQLGQTDLKQPLSNDVQ